MNGKDVAPSMAAIAPDQRAEQGVGFHPAASGSFLKSELVTCGPCGRSISGSWSTGRNDRCGYYHCPKFESAFVAHLESLQPAPGYLRLFRASVLDAWRVAQTKAGEIERVRGVRVAELHSRADRLDEAFIYDRSIPCDVYERQRDKLQEDLALAELELHDARIDGKDVEGVLGFAEYLLTNAARVWQEATLPQRQQLQRAILPQGLPFDGRGFGTAPTCLAFSHLQGIASVENGMASPPGVARQRQCSASAHRRDAGPRRVKSFMCGFDPSVN